MLDSLKLALKQLFCAHRSTRHVDTVRIHAEGRGMWGTQIDYHECQDCKKQLAVSTPMECVATFD